MRSVNLRQEGLDFELHFMGVAARDNPNALKFLDRVQNRPYLSGRSFRSVSEMIEQYDQASALVHVSAIETFGLVVAEALARNLKFFGLSVGGVLDIATGIEGAELFEDGDWPGLKSSMARWIRSGFPQPETAARMMCECFHPDEIAYQHVKIYREVLNLC